MLEIFSPFNLGSRVVNQPNKWYDYDMIGVNTQWLNKDTCKALP